MIQQEKQVKQVELKSEINLDLATNPDITQADHKDQSQEISNIEIRFANGMVRTVSANLEQEKVCDIKQKVFENEFKEGIECQLIYMGKFMDDNVPLKSLSNLFYSDGLEDGICMHGRIKEKQQANLSAVIFQVQKKKSQPRGFDQLVNSGLSLEEIEMMRAQFHSGQIYSTDTERYQREQE